MTWAAFDIPADPPHRERRLRGRFLRPPVRVLQAHTPAEVAAVVTAAEAASLAGNWVLGGLRYPAAGAWDPAQRALPATGPVASFEVYPDPPDPWPEATTGLPGLDWRPDPYLAGGRTGEAAVRRVLGHIAAGDCYQVNLTTRFRAYAPQVDLFGCFAALTTAQPGGYAVFSATAGVASVSPELFFHRHGEHVVTQPMKGTASLASGPEALGTPKERAENLMIVDLLRNDLGRVCRTGTVRVDRLFEVHRLPTLWQQTSTVSGRLPPGTPLADVLAALFPCASVTGAPKLAAMRVITELEGSPRGWYCGALGLVRPGGEATFNVPIRTVERDGDALLCGVGSGIVADSDPAAEVAEWHAKAAFLGVVPLRGLETMLLADGAIARRRAHLQRLAATCAAHRLPLDPGAVDRLLDQACTDHPSGRFRVRLVAGGGAPELALAAAPDPGTPMLLRLAPAPLDAGDLLGPLIRHKTTHRTHYDRLRAAGGDADDVICHNSRGELTEGTLGNIALCLDGEWVTPPEEAGLLPGVLRAELLASGRLRERRLRAGRPRPGRGDRVPERAARLVPGPAGHPGGVAGVIAWPTRPAACRVGRHGPRAPRRQPRGGTRLRRVSGLLALDAGQTGIRLRWEHGQERLEGATAGVLTDRALMPQLADAIGAFVTGHRLAPVVVGVGTSGLVTPEATRTSRPHRTLRGPRSGGGARLDHQLPGRARRHHRRRDRRRHGCGDAARSELPPSPGWTAGAT